MFSVIISEKGGAERRETFDRTEINVGRVQGNDLMLPKGNVSKRHARLLFRDGRFIVTDLKSTNGTYVNGRKIAQATIVREGDKIYIGDFVVRIEAGSGPTQSQPAGVPSSIPLADDAPSDLQSAPPGPPIAPVPPTAASPVAHVTPHAVPDGAASSPRPRTPVEAFHDGAASGPKPRPPAEASGPTPAPVPAPAPAPEGSGGGGGSRPQPPKLDGGTLQSRVVPVPVPPLVLPPSPVSAAPNSPEMAVLRSSSFPIDDGGSSGRRLDPPSSSSQPSSTAEKALRAPSPRIEPKTGDRHEVISHFPLEHDPDESVHFAVPAPPRVPSSPRPIGGKTPPLPQAPTRGQPTAPGTPYNAPFDDGGRAPKPLVDDGGRAPKPPVDDGGRAPKPLVDDGGRAPKPPVEPSRPPTPSPQSGAVPAHHPPPAPGRRATVDGGKSYAGEIEAAARGRAGATSLGERAPLEPARAAAQRQALVALLDRAHELVDLRPLAGGATPDDALVARIERALVDAASALRASAPGSELDVDGLLVDARRELCEYGPLTPLFDDEDVTEIQVVRHDHVVALHGRRQVPSDVSFSSEQAVGRAIRRLCLAAGKPLGEGEAFVERRLARGGRMFAVLPRAEDHGHMVVIRKPQRADLTLEDLVRSGTISRAISGLLTQCVAGRGNILVTGAVGAGTTTLIGALAGAGSTEDRVVVLQEDDELIFNQPHTISILLGDTAEEGARAVQAAARVRPDRLVVGAFAGAAAAELVDAMGNGVDGVIAGARAPTLRQAVLRLTADIAATRPGLSPEVAREWLASVFDLAIEVARLRDGRHRVLRVAELGIEGNRVALRDIFTFTVERTAAGGAIEGSFTPSGVVPGIVDDLLARGVPVDPSIFRRHPRPDEGGVATRTPAEGLMLGALLSKPPPPPRPQG